MSKRFSIAPLFALLLFPAYLVHSADALDLDAQKALASLAIDENCPASMELGGHAQQVLGSGKFGSEGKLLVRRMPGESKTITRRDPKTGREYPIKIETPPTTMVSLVGEIEGDKVSLSDANGLNAPSRTVSEVNSGLTTRGTLSHARASESKPSAACIDAAVTYGALFKLETVKDAANPKRREKQSDRREAGKSEPRTLDETNPYDSPTQTQGAR